MLKIVIVVTIIVQILTGCAARPAIRQEHVGLPPLESSWSRMYVSAGFMNGIKLWSVHQVGPVFVNNELVGTTAEDEHLAIDLPPGTYEAYCTPEQPYKNFIEKRQVTFMAGETRHFACDMDSKGVGLAFGLIGALASEYVTKTYLEERPMDNPKSKLVSYKKLRNSK